MVILLLFRNERSNGSSRTRRRRPTPPRRPAAAKRFDEYSGFINNWKHGAAPSGGPREEIDQGLAGFRPLSSLLERLLPPFGLHRLRLAAATASPRGCSQPRSSLRPYA